MRYYDLVAARVLSEDSLGFKAGLNFYAYVGNNPLRCNDQWGWLIGRKLVGYLPIGV